MSDAATYAIELAVGVVTLGAAVAAWRAGGRWWLASALGVAGIAACLHAVIRLVG